MDGAHLARQRSLRAWGVKLWRPDAKEIAILMRIALGIAELHTDARALLERAGVIEKSVPPWSSKVSRTHLTPSSSCPKARPSRRYRQVPAGWSSTRAAPRAPKLRAVMTPAPTLTRKMAAPPTSNPSNEKLPSGGLLLAVDPRECCRRSQCRAPQSRRGRRAPKPRQR